MFFICLFAIAMIAVGVAVFNLNLDTRGGGLSDVALANIEALAQSEIGDGYGDCFWRSALVICKGEEMYVSFCVFEGDANGTGCYPCGACTHSCSGGGFIYV